MLAAMARKSYSLPAIKHMQQTAKTRHGPGAPGFAITRAEYISLGRFSNDAEKLGVKSTGLDRSLFGTGICLKLAGKSAQYEVHVRDSQLLLGKVEPGEKRVRLCAAWANQAGCEKLFLALKHSKKNL